MEEITLQDPVRLPGTNVILEKGDKIQIFPKEVEKEVDPLEEIQDKIDEGKALTDEEKETLKSLIDKAKVTEQEKEDDKEEDKKPKKKKKNGDEEENEKNEKEKEKK